jgi:hypothetical protein
VWTFRDTGKNKTEILKADNYEYPFDIILEGSLPESVEGLEDSFVIYRFKAEIGRKYTKDIVVRRPLRIIRTLDSSALELAHAMVSICLAILVRMSDHQDRPLRISGRTRSNTLSVHLAKPSSMGHLSKSNSV